MQKQNNIYHGIKKSLYPDKYGDAAISNHYILQNITMPELFPFSDGFYEPLSDTK